MRLRVSAVLSKSELELDAFFFERCLDLESKYKRFHPHHTPGGYRYLHSGALGSGGAEFAGSRGWRFWLGHQRG